MEGAGPRAHFAGLDSIRFVAALWVVLSHIPFPLAEAIDRSHWTGWLLVGVFNNAFSGPAAVIVFFLVSGFCIHIPYARGQPFSLLPFLVRRYVRIGVPLLAAIALCLWMGVDIGYFERTILWSLYAELIYYTLYPALRVAQARWGWGALIAVSYVACLMVILSMPDAGDYPSYGTAFNWIVGLPCWLLGCQLAQHFVQPRQSQPAAGGGSILAWRTRIWAFSVIASALRFHTPIGYPWSLSIFAAAVYYWLVREMVWTATHRPSRVLEWAGGWSYSIYLIHLPADIVLRHQLRLAELGPQVHWILKGACILGMCYLFHLAVEKPSHRMARALTRKG